jgi:DNA-directed RNA polymerase I, II, and III subunit RPABC3
MAAAKDMGHPMIFEDSFVVGSIDNSRFERAGRVTMMSKTMSNKLEIDINNIIYPVKPDETFQVALTDNVSPPENRKNLKNAHDHDARILGASIMDQYEYVMYGKVYKKTDSKPAKEGQARTSTVFVSYGGLLMKLDSEEYEALKDLHVNDGIYFMMRRVETPSIDPTLPGRSDLAGMD